MLTASSAHTMLIVDVPILPFCMEIHSRKLKPGVCPAAGIGLAVGLGLGLG